MALLYTDWPVTKHLYFHSTALTGVECSSLSVRRLPCTVCTSYVEVRREFERLKGAWVQVGHVVVAYGLRGWNAWLNFSPRGGDLTPMDFFFT